MDRSGVTFGTSGARGRVEDMTDEVCHAYTLAFLQHLAQSGRLEGTAAVAVGGDLRPSTPRIMGAVAQAAADRGHRVINCGPLPSPALALYGLEQSIPAIMVTGSHIPADRNGIKFNAPEGEILKADEADIRAQQVEWPLSGASSFSIPEVDPAAINRYVSRYLDFFPANSLAGLRLGVYEHSSVARDILPAILEGLGAEVVRLGRSDIFIPVDTEAIRPEDVALARRWVSEHRLDSLISTDGDADRPLISDEKGNWLRGDVLGIICARFLGADTVVTPVSSNTAAEKSGFFRRVVRTRIGSPYVIEGMQQAMAAGGKRVVGYEANGGFLTAGAVERQGRVLAPLPTRDAVIVLLSLLMAARGHGSISCLVGSLPARFTASGRVKDFPTEIAREKVQALLAGGTELEEVKAVLAPQCGQLAAVDGTDGARLTFEDGDIVHFRPSGNAPELRCYVEAGRDERTQRLLIACTEWINKWSRD